jgi:hypothetical protein
MRDGTPKGYAFLNVNGNRYTIDYKVAGEPSDYQIRLFHPKVVAQGRRTQAGVFANFFMGHEGNTVEYRINGGNWQPMTYVEMPDPDFVWQLYQWDTTEELMPGRRPSNAVDSKHLWRGSIPTDMAVGEYRIDVRATDMFGRTFTHHGSYRLAK